MKLYIKNRIKEKTSKRDRISQIQRNLNNIINFSRSTKTNSLLDSQTRNQIQSVNINVERSKALALQANRNHRIV